MFAHKAALSTKLYFYLTQGRKFTPTFYLMIVSQNNQSIEQSNLILTYAYAMGGKFLD